MVIYNKAYAEMMRWMLVNWGDMQVSSDVHPHGVLSVVMIRRLKEFLPCEACSLELLGMVTWDDVVAELDINKKGYVLWTDLGQFWDMYGVRNAYSELIYIFAFILLHCILSHIYANLCTHTVKNREKKEIHSKSTLALAMFEAMHKLAEENLLLDEENSKRSCTIHSYYVGMLDLKLKQSDKDFLYTEGKKDTLAWSFKYGQ